MSAFKDRTGERFGRLIVIELAEKGTNIKTKWKCKCDCGNTVVVTSSHLVTGTTNSCGCLRKDTLRSMTYKHGNSARGNKTRLYKVWQTMNSLYAIGSGGLTGLGLGQSREKYLYLPEPQNDFVFAVVVEELGLIGGVIILLIFVLLVIRGIMISLRAKDKFGMFLGVGLVSQIGLQVVLNILVITDTLPNTGISLPFFSYGGTSLLMLLAQMGIVLSISRNSNINKT